MRLADLLAPFGPGKPVINLSVGEPQHAVPDFVGPVLARHVGDFNKYPPNKGIEGFRKAAAAWLSRRYQLPRPLDTEGEIMVLCGTREGLFLAAIAAKRFVPPRAGRPAILIPNPFYAVYSAAAQGAECEPVYLPATAATGFLPDLDALDDALLSRAVAFYIASPANPQGAVASPDYLKRLVSLARRHGFLIFADECYSEIYTKAPPPGMLEYAGPDYANVLVFHSLSKRSNLAGLRIGFVAGDANFLSRYLDLRSVSSPQAPIPLQQVAIAAYSDESHVEENRRLYAQKFDLADQIVGDRYGYRRPAGGFFLWLDVGAQGGGEQAALKLWREAGLRVLPGGYVGRPDSSGRNPGDNYIRVAMVQNNEITAEALHRLVAVLG
ncbi:MAG TPA: aminotransferase class I/II-fold pyridoxal phosphate-dependent enzyme [Pseudorhodoplanes sp.]|nr:aminotransferase class I/II-fold pyridoxal phosphate-dependent enzyme [Pseudorhodoplanes sp.]